MTNVKKIKIQGKDAAIIIPENELAIKGGSDVKIESVSQSEKPRKKRVKKAKVVKAKVDDSKSVVSVEEPRQSPVTNEEAIAMIIAIVSACIQIGEKEVPLDTIQKFFSPVEPRFFHVFNSIEDQLTVSVHDDVRYYSYNRFKSVSLNGNIASNLSLKEVL